MSLYRSPLGQVLPAVPSGRVVEEPFKPKLTELGEKHPVTRDLSGSKGTSLLGGLGSAWSKPIRAMPKC